MRDINWNTLSVFKTRIMGKYSLPSGLILAVLLVFNLSGQAQKAFLGDSLGGAPVPFEIEDPECIGINKEPHHATLMPYADLREALAANRHASSFCRSLNGTWRFNWVSWPQSRPVEFFKPGFDVSSWKEIPVPSNWQILGYGTPIYNFALTIKKDFPRVMNAPPKTYTSYIERNPVGSYRRDFEVPAEWIGRRIFITFDGVDAGFFLWVNGKKVGYSVNSRNAAEFDITKLVKPGKNMIAVEVYTYTSGTYLEDQDMWRLSGIFRNVTIWSAPQLHVRDFFIKTDLDDRYRDGTVEVNARVRNYSEKPVKASTLAIQLYQAGMAVRSAMAEGPVPDLRPGEEASVNLTFNVPDPEKWTAETPNLYTTVLTVRQGNRVIETLSSRTGFREIEIRGKLFLVNGTPIKLKGVNRHEHWPDVGHAITEAQMIRDLEMIKQGNCNFVRTSHYTDDPRWYELCDEWGIFLVAEANAECHSYVGRAFVCALNEDPTIKAAIIDRNMANAENLKNHPSVILWSLGNECGRGGTNFRAAMASVRALDPTRPIYYCDFGFGAGNPGDIDAQAYDDFNDLDQIVNDTSFKKPFLMPEYGHAMFNSMGSLVEYSEVFDKYPGLLGGAIWEWQDQGIYNNRNPDRPIIAFGGGFGDFPNAHYFIHKGVVASDRSLKPHYPEMKKAYQWIGISADDIDRGVFKIKNKYQFINLDGFLGEWTLSENGTEISRGTLNLPKLLPGKETLITIPYHIAAFNPGSEYFLRISFTLANDVGWAGKGFEMAWQQFEIPSKLSDFEVVLPATHPLAMIENNNEVVITSSGFVVVFDKSAGTFTKFESRGVNILKPSGGPRLHLWRAPHRDDDMWADKGWVESGLKELKWTTGKVVIDRKSSSAINISVSLTGEGKNNFSVSHEVVYTIFGDGTIHAENTFSSNKPDLALARIGVRMFIDKGFDQFSYFGRGPMENYADRKLGSDIGMYHSTVNEQLTPYEKPMEAGNHEDVRRAKVTNTSGNGIMVNCDSTLLQVSALPYSDEELEKPEYRIDLPQVSSTVFCISYRTLGVGSASCGPWPLPEYTVKAIPCTFSYRLRLLPARNN